MNENGVRTVTAFRLGNEHREDIIYTSVFYFSRMPMVENKGKCNRTCSKFYGVILLVAATVTTFVQLLLMNYQWKSVMEKHRD